MTATELSWVSVDLLTGAILADLSDVEITSTLSRTIGQYESATATLHITAATPPQWLRAVMAGGAVLCAYIGEPGSERVLYGGIVDQRVRDLSPGVTLSLVTAEAYLDACFCDGYASTDGQTWDQIVAALVNGYAANTGRVPFTVVQSTTPASGAGSYSAAAGSNTTVYAALQQLGAQGVVEFTVDWVWNHGAGPGGTDTITPTLTEGARIGVAAPAGMAPAATFESENLIAATVSEDYTNGQGANIVTVYGQPTAGAQVAPVATAQELQTNGRPLWEYRFTPAQTTSSIATLTTYAVQAVGLMAEGSQPVTLQAALGQPGLEYGTDWSIGDDIGYLITGPAFPTPVAGTARCIGYETDLTSITPILQGVVLP